MANENYHSKKNVNLENIEKKAVFKVSDNYFDDLPTRIQKRVVEHDQRRTPAFVFSQALQYALPVIAFVAISVYLGVWFNKTDVDVQAMIDQVSTEELMTYLNEEDITTDEIIALIDLEELDIDGMLDQEIDLFGDTDLIDILDEYPEYEIDFNE